MRIAIVLAAFVLSACATILAPEYPLIEGPLENGPSNPENTKLILYNKSDHILAATAQPMEVVINQKAVASLRVGEYVQIELPKGVHDLQLTHWDLFPFKTTHRLEVGGNIMSVAVYSTVASNEVTTLEGLPSDRWRPRNFRPYAKAR